MSGSTQVNPPWTRRQFLRITSVGATSFVLLACAGPNRSPTPISATTPIPARLTPTERPTTPTDESVTATVEPTPTIPPTSQPTPFPSPAPIDVSWWTGPSSGPWLKGIHDVTSQFTQAHPNVTVKVSGGHSDFGRIVSGIATGQAPDALDVGGIPPFASRGLITSLDSRLPDSSIGPGNFYPAMWESGKWNGQVFGITALDHGPELGLIWNQTLDNGVAIPSGANQTFGDVYQIGRLMTRSDPAGAIDTLGFDPLDGVGSLLDTVRDLSGQDWIDPSAHRITILNPVYVTYLADIQRYYRDLGADRVTRFRQAVPPLTDSRDSGENRGRQVALISGYWAVSDVATLEQNPSWTFHATWAPANPGAAQTQRVGGRLLVIPKGAREPGGGWDLIKYLVGDDANNAMFDQSGRFASTRSFIAGGRWKSQPPFQFFVDSLASATHLTSRATNSVASFAQAKWEQAVADVFGGNLPITEALAAAQKAVENEYHRVGGAP